MTERTDNPARLDPGPPDHALVTTGAHRDGPGHVLASGTWGHVVSHRATLDRDDRDRVTIRAPRHA